MDLILVRHAQPERTDDSADPVLTERGRAQADATGAFLAGERVDAIVASPLQRARHTAVPLADRLGLEIQTIEGLREIDPFRGAYVPAEELTLDHGVVQQFMADPLALFAGEGGFETFRATVVGAFDDIVAANKGRTVVAFCHGTVIGTYLTDVLGHADPFVLNPDYCGLYRLKASGDLRTLRSANETGHVRDLLG